MAILSTTTSRLSASRASRNDIAAGGGGGGSISVLCTACHDAATSPISVQHTLHDQQQPPPSHHRKEMRQIPPSPKKTETSPKRNTKPSSHAFPFTPVRQLGIGPSQPRALNVAPSPTPRKHYRLPTTSTADWRSNITPPAAAAPFYTRLAAPAQFQSHNRPPRTMTFQARGVFTRRGTGVLVSGSPMLLGSGCCGRRFRPID